MAYPSKRVAITYEATASPAEIEAAGGKITLTIRNHLIQDEDTAEAVANAYLAVYKKQKTKIRIMSTAPLPYEVGDAILYESYRLVGEAEKPYKPLAEAEMPYKPLAEAEHYYKSVVRHLVIRKINLSFRAGNFISTLELEE
ncbi:hypothetical protein ES705_49067 [subsurface metagenome]